MYRSLSDKVIFLSIAVLIIATACISTPATASDWKLVTPDKFTTANLYTVYGFAPDDLYAAGSCGIMYHFNGTDWKKMLVPKATTIDAMWGTDSNNIYAVGGEIFHYNGNFWETMDAGPIEQLYDIWGTAADNIYVVGRNGMFLRYNGKSWSKINTDNNYTLTGIWGSGPEDIYIAARSKTVDGDGTILHYNGESVTSTTIPREGFSDVWGTAPDNVYALGSNKIFHFDGTRWEQEDNNTTQQFTEITGADENNIYAIANDLGTILHYNGSKWTLHTLGGKIWGVFALTPEKVFATGAAGALFTYDGIKWTTLSSGDSETYHDVWGDGTGNVYIAPSNLRNDAVVLHYDGAEWTKKGESGSFNGIRGTSTNNIYAVGANHTVRHYDGIKWTDIYTGENTTNLLSIWGSGDSNVYAVGQDSNIHLYTGTEWIIAAMGFTGFLTDIWGVSTSYDIYITNTNGQIYKYGGEGWKTDYSPSSSISPSRLYSIHGAGGSIAAVGSSGRVVSYQNGTWFPIVTPTESMLFDIWFSNPDNAYAVGDWGEVLHYDGNEWQKRDSGTTQALYGVWGSNPNNFYAVGSGSTVLHFSGNTNVRVNEDEQAAGAKVKILDATRSAIDQTTLEAGYNTINRKPLTDVREFIASVSDNTKGIFHYNIKDVSGPVSKLRLLKLLPSGTASEYAPYDPAANTGSPSGTWWIENSSNVPLLESTELDSTQVYTVYFIIDDNSEYDINPADELIYDPVLLTKNTAPETAEDNSDSGGGGGGCGITRDPNEHAYDLAFLLLMATLLLGLRNRGRHNRTQHYPESRIN